MLGAGVMRRAIAGFLLLAACGPNVAVSDAGASSAADSTAGDPPTSTVASPTSSTSSDAPDSADDDIPPASSDDGGFLAAPDGGGFECDIWIDDCPPGMKCMPFANDGGGAWNDAKCMPLAEDPHAVGEPCTVEGNGVSGIDDCEARAMCWDVDPETNAGTCVAFCTGSEAKPTCADPCSRCRIFGEGVPIPCLPDCDPLAQDCGEGSACYPAEGRFDCAPDQGGDAGVLGDACEFINVCDPGLFCAPPETQPGCAGATGCCAAFCDALDADACAAIPGTECIPWFDEGEGRSCTKGVVGGCLLPE
jgi:hypothetical protein